MMNPLMGAGSQVQYGPSVLAVQIPKPPIVNPGTYGNGSQPLAMGAPATAASNSVRPSPAMNPGVNQAPSTYAQYVAGAFPPMSGGHKGGGARMRGGRKHGMHQAPVAPNGGKVAPGPGPIAGGLMLKKQ